MKYTKKEGVSGAWLKADDVEDGTLIKIVSETNPVPGQYGDQDVCKVRVKGKEGTFNLSLNRTTIHALIDAFGEDSASWVDIPLSTHKEKMTVSGRRVNVLYLIPAGYELGEDDAGYIVITKTEEKKESKVKTPTSYEEEQDMKKEAEEEISPDDIPF